MFPYRDAREAGVAVGLGTDGPGSNNSLDLLADAKVFALLQKNEARDPGRGHGRRDAGDRDRPPFGAARRRAGSAVGAPADFLLVRSDDPELSLGALDAGLVYAASGSIVDTTVVGGRVLMRGGVVEGAEEVVARPASAGDWIRSARRRLSARARIGSHSRLRKGFAATCR